MRDELEDRPARSGPVRLGRQPWVRSSRAAAAALLSLLLLARGATAQERVPLGENFGDQEVVGIFVLGALDVGSFVLEGRIAEARDPLLGDPWHWDRRVSERAYRGAGSGEWLKGVPDLTGQVIAPALTFAVYGVDGFAAYFGHPIWGRHADHELLALAEAYAVTVGATQAAKLAVGRWRPEYELERI